MNVFVYKVECYDADTDRKAFYQHGVGLGIDYADAAKEIEKRYKDELISIEYLAMLEECDTYTLPVSEEVFKGYKEDFYDICWEYKKEGDKND